MQFEMPHSKLKIDDMHDIHGRILYGNRIGELPAGIFQGLSSLQLLLLNANRISCVRRDTFRDLTNLNLL